MLLANTLWTSYDDLVFQRDVELEGPLDLEDVLHPLLDFLDSVLAPWEGIVFLCQDVGGWTPLLLSNQRSVNYVTLMPDVLDLLLAS